MLTQNIFICFSISIGNKEQADDTLSGRFQTVSFVVGKLSDFSEIYTDTSKFRLQDFNYLHTEYLFDKKRWVLLYRNKFLVNLNFTIFFMCY